MMYRVTEYLEGSVNVEITRNIRVGQVLRINPSEGYLGLDSGIITIMHIGTKAQLEALGNEHITQMIEADYEAMLDSLDPSYDEDREARERLDTEPWVVSSYTKDGVLVALPLEVFLEHTMTY